MYNLYKITKSDRTHLRKALKHFIDGKGNTYQSIAFTSVLFQYILLDSNTKVEMPTITPEKVSTQSFGDYSYPLSMDLKHWGKIIEVKGNVTTLVNDNPSSLYKNMIL